jgi:hypothetical protein
MVVVEAAPTPAFGWQTIMPALPGVVATLFAVWAVHKLTRNREREKAVFELYKSVREDVALLKSAAVTAWGCRKGPDRRTAIAETKWRLQQVGGTVERLRRLSKRRRFARDWKLWVDASIYMTGDMRDLRDALTDDPFEDPARSADKVKAEAIEQAVGGFLSALDDKFYQWMR